MQSVDALLKGRYLERDIIILCVRVFAVQAQFSRSHGDNGGAWN
jgi:hypothetical protein